jgi:hypothetical protein
MANTLPTLESFDQEAVSQYNITRQDLENVGRYVMALQGHLSPNTLDDIALGGYYGTSALLHEVVELRLLLKRDPALLRRSATDIKRFATSPANYDAHLRAMEAEYRYLQSAIKRLFDRYIDMGALVKANARRPFDWDSLFDTDLSFHKPQKEDIVEAEELLFQLKEAGR